MILLGLNISIFYTVTNEALVKEKFNLPNI